MPVRSRAVLLVGGIVSRSELNLALLAIDRDEAALAAFEADPAGFVEPYRLSTDERRALET